MLPVLIILIQCIKNHLQVRFIVQEIGIAGIYEKGFDIMLLDIMRIGFLDIEEIIIRDILFVGAVSFFNIHLQLRYRRMQVNQDIRLHQLLVNDFK